MNEKWMEMSINYPSYRSSFITHPSSFILYPSSGIL
jgi:hypothetical protein